MRDNSDGWVKNVVRGRVLNRKHEQARASLISVRELRALEGTLAVLENQNLMTSILSGLDDVKAGRTESAADAFAELDAEFRSED